MTSTRFLSMILAHQGGWDEAALVIAPLALVALLLWLANRRVDQRLAEQEATEADRTGPS